MNRHLDSIESIRETSSHNVRRTHEGTWRMQLEMIGTGWNDLNPDNFCLPVRIAVFVDPVIRKVIAMKGFHLDRQVSDNQDQLDESLEKMGIRLDFIKLVT